MPNTDIHKGIIKVLTDFANNITRYYNLDFITGKINPKTQQDPIKAWFNQVIIPILNEHLTQKQKNKIQKMLNLLTN